MRPPCSCRTPSVSFSSRRWLHDSQWFDYSLRNHRVDQLLELVGEREPGLSWHDDASRRVLILKGARARVCGWTSNSERHAERAAVEIDEGSRVGERLYNFWPIDEDHFRLVRRELQRLSCHDGTSHLSSRLERHTASASKPPLTSYCGRPPLAPHIMRGSPSEVERSFRPARSAFP